MIPRALPTGWAVRRLADVTTMMTNGFVGTVAGEYVTRGGVPYLMANNVREQRMDLSTVTYVSRDFHKRNQRTQLRAGDVLTVQTGSIGVSCVVTSVMEGANAHALIISRVKDSEALAEYVCYWLNSYEGRRFANRVQTGGGRPHLNTSDLAEAELPLPPLEEQRRVVGVLVPWERALLNVESLADAARSRRRALLQLLMTDRRGRSPREARWEEIPFSDVFSEKQERNSGSRIQTAITVGKYGITRQSDKYTKSLTSADVENYWVIRSGDFVYDPMSAYYGAIGRFELDEPGIVSPAYRVQTLKAGYDSDFIKYVLKTHYVRYQLEAFSSQNNQTGKRRLLQREAFAEVSFPCPAIEEQRRIAAVLVAAEREVALLELLRSAYRRQKKGLTQQLLTGKLLVAPGPARRAS